jgi:hypothetical protein
MSGSSKTVLRSCGRTSHSVQRSAILSWVKGATAMTAWHAVQYVGSAFSLIAFVVAAIFYVYRERSRSKAAMIRSAPPADRLRAIESLAEIFHVDVSGLPAKQQMEIVIERLRIRSRRDLLVFYSFVSLAVICGGVVLTAIVFDGSPVPKPIACNDKPAQNPESDVTRVVAFSYGASDRKNPSKWARPTPGRWVETNDEGENHFSVERRVNYGPCDGTIVAKMGEPTLQLLISDKSCSTRDLFFRRAPSCSWLGLPKMYDVR